MINPGRHTARVADGEPVLFLVGMRINRLWQPWKWLPVVVAMSTMIPELMRDPGHGLLGRPRTLVSGRVITVLQYWESFDHLEAYARAADHRHLPAWRAFNRRSRGNVAVGIFHETYLLSPGRVETMYVDMPPFGLAAALGAATVGAGANTAAQRLGRSATRAA